MQQESVQVNTLVSNIKSDTKKLLTDFSELSNETFFDSLGNQRSSCKYYDVDDFLSLNYKANLLSIFHLNISSLSNHFDELCSYLDILKHNFGIIGITETRFLKDSPNIFNCNLPNYQYIHTPTESTVGGAMLYISNKLSFKHRDDLSSLLYKSKELESVFIELNQKNEQNIVIGCVYRHPCMSINEFLDEYLSPFLELSSNENKKLILLGDFNIDLLKFETSNSVSNFIDLISSYYVMPQIFLPTRITQNSKTLIDNIFVNSFESTYTAGNLLSCISDHLPQFLFIHRFSSYDKENRQTIERDWPNFQENEFADSISNIIWDDVLKISSNDVDHSLESFMNSIDGLLDQHAPFVKLTKNKFLIKPWLNSKILGTIRQRDHLFKLFLKAKNSLLKSLLKDRYKKTRNLVVNLIRRSKRNYYLNYFSENSKNLRKTWQGINTLIYSNKKKSLSPTELLINGTSISDKSIIANAFNDYFTNIAQEIRSLIPFSHTPFDSFLTNSNHNSLFLSPTTSMEVYDCISLLSNNKSYGPFSIPVRILKLVKMQISEPLAIIINLSFELGYFPSVLKTAKVIPIFKKGSPVECNNYRPISLLSNIDKIFESLMHKRVSNFLNHYNLIYLRQFGFRKHHSTTHALLNISEEIRLALDNGNFACGVFVDLQKAFDTVDHNFLLLKLAHYGIRGISNSWFRSYLSNRSQFVDVNGFKSSVKPIVNGVPQGSVLGPLLFLIYINDIYSAVSFSTVYLFADDTNLLYTHPNLKVLSERINADLSNLNIWLNANKISLNSSKTEYLLFRHSRKSLNYNFTLTVDCHVIKPSKHIKYLGLYLDENLNFHHHTSIMASKLRRANGALCKIRHYVPLPVLKTVYYALFHSIMSYASVVWGQNPGGPRKRIFILQKRATRIMSFASPRTHSSPLFKNLEIIKLHDHIQCQNIIFIYQILNKRISEHLISTFRIISFDHNYPTRGNLNEDFRFPLYNTISFGKMSVKYQSLKSWQMIKLQFPNLKISDLSIANLKSILRMNFLDSY